MMVNYFRSHNIELAVPHVCCEIDVCVQLPKGEWPLTCPRDEAESEVFQVVGCPKEELRTLSFTHSHLTSGKPFRMEIRFNGDYTELDYLEFFF